jgi:hypothetical protein
LFWPLAHQYRHIVPLNPKGIIANKRLFDVYPNKGLSPKALCAVLNSTLVALLKYLYGRQVGREGNLDTEVIDSRLMLVPDIRQAPPSLVERLEKSFDTLRGRPSLPLIEELEQAERIGLDDLTLDVLGVSESEERQRLRNELYGEMKRLYREIREVELKKQVERRITARQGRASPRTVAEEIWAEFDKSQLRAFPADFLHDGEPMESITLPAGQPRILDDLFDRGAVQVNGTVVQLGSKDRAAFAAKMIELGNYGDAQIPKADRACQRALESYDRYEKQISATLQEMAEERSADPEIQSRIVRELYKLSHAYGRALPQE